MVLRFSYFHNGIFYTDKITYLYWIRSLTSRIASFDFSSLTTVWTHTQWLELICVSSGTVCTFLHQYVHSTKIYMHMMNNALRVIPYTYANQFHASLGKLKPQPGFYIQWKWWGVLKTAIPVWMSMLSPKLYHFIVWKSRKIRDWHWSQD